MKKQQVKKQTLPKAIVVPKFATEAEEADWWYQKRKAHSEEFYAAAQCGESAGADSGKTARAHRSVKKETRAGRRATDSRRRLGACPQTGRTERPAVPNLHQVHLA